MVFFGIAFILHYDEDDDADITKSTGVVSKLPLLPPKISVEKVAPVPALLSMEDEEVVCEVVSGSIPSYSLESLYIYSIY
jgi:fructose-1-phosphate kinase PfkB-like protein